MYTQLATKLSGTDERSHAVSMDGNNTVRIDVVVYTGTLTLTLQESNDGENWTANVSAFANVTGPAYKLLGARTVAAQYVRIAWSAKGTMIVAVGMNLSKQ